MNPLLVQAAAEQGWRHRRGLVALAVVPVVAIGGLVVVLLALLTAGSTSNSLTAAACDAANDPYAVEPADLPTLTLGGLDEAQLRHASTIVSVGQAGGVPRQGWVIAVATALQESGLRNYASTVYPQTVADPRAEAVGSDHDSVGLFQQRPSSGWGAPLLLLDPAHAAGGFYGGPAAGRTTRGLLDYPTWQMQPLSVASHWVQRSAFPDAVARWEPLARDIVDAISAALPAETSIGSTSGMVAVDLSTDSGCPDGEFMTIGSATFADGDQTLQLPRANPNDAVQAIAWARREALAPTRPGGWYRLCSSFVAHSYGYGMSGVTYAIDQWNGGMPRALKHPGDRNPPPGALLFWDTGQRAGHVALYLGDGLIATNDIEAAGRISVVPAAAVEERWGSTYLGWTAPYFARAG